MRDAWPEVNPFCTRRVRPGAVPYFFPDGMSPAVLVERLRAAGWCGQVVGPHGSGKSTLLAALRPPLQAVRPQIVAAVCHDGQRSPPASFWQAVASASPEALVIVDGYEQLGRWSRWRLWLACRRQRLGLLVTAHVGVGLPEVYRTVVTPEVAVRVVEHLTAGAMQFVSVADVTACLTAQGGNLREALFELFDLHERRTRDIGYGASVPEPNTHPGVP